MNKILRVKCPTCATIFSYYESEFRPFCSERCRLIDLGHWFEESYRVPEKDKKQIETEDYAEDYEREPKNYEQSYNDEEDNESEYEH